MELETALVLSESGQVEQVIEAHSFTRKVFGYRVTVQKTDEQYAFAVQRIVAEKDKPVLSTPYNRQTFASQDDVTLFLRINGFANEWTPAEAA